jgi:hypothetical protein
MGRAKERVVGEGGLLFVVRGGGVRCQDVSWRTQNDMTYGCGSL